MQALPSLHAVPLGWSIVEHIPLAGSQTPTAWHWSPARQTTGLAPEQAPAWQVSVWVHALLSSHVVPFALAGFVQTPVAGLHAPTSWHWSCATHVTALPPTQAPAWQLSVWVHALASLQVMPSAFAGFV